MDVKQKLQKNISNLKVLHTKNNDDCYTTYDDIAKEVSIWGKMAF